MKVLVTGASGFIGYNTLDILISKGYEVYALTNGNTHIASNGIVKWYKINLLNSLEIDKILQIVKPDYILHFAWYAIPGKYISSNENLKWVKSSFDLLRKFKKNGGKKFVFAGTCFQYDLSYGYLDEETTPSNPNTLYGTCKNRFENMAIEYCKINDISFTSGRIFYVYGERENKNRIVPYVVNKLIREEQAHCSLGNQIRDFMYVKDVANAFVEILYSKLEGVVNVASAEPVELKNIILKIGKNINKEELINLGAIKSSYDEPKIIVGNNTKLKSNTSWIQRYNLDEGIERTINWWEKVNMKNEK